MIQGERQEPLLPMSLLRNTSKTIGAHQTRALNEGSAAEGTTVVGLISDTHGVLEETTISALRRASRVIIHAGDVGDTKRKSRLPAENIIRLLEEGTEKEIIPVAGNTDEGVAHLPAHQTLEVCGKKILVIHISGYPPKDTDESRQLVESESADIVVFGHSHVPGVEKHGKTLYINREIQRLVLPLEFTAGSAGPRRFQLPRCIAFLSIHPSGEVLVEFWPTGARPQDLSSLPKSFADVAGIKSSMRGSKESTNILTADSHPQRRRKRKFDQGSIS